MPLPPIFIESYQNTAPTKKVLYKKKTLVNSFWCYQKYFEKYQVGSDAKKVGSAIESTVCGKYYTPYPKFDSMFLTALSENSITPVTLTSGSPSCVCGGVRYSAWCYELDLWRYQYITLWPEFQYIYHLDTWNKI